jgi:hypothetical protein
MVMHQMEFIILIHNINIYININPIQKILCKDMNTSHIGFEIEYHIVVYQLELNLMEYHIMVHQL